MKTWFTYIASVLFALATAFLFADYELAAIAFSQASTYLLRIGTFITIPLIAFSFTSAIASIRKDKLGTSVASGLTGWTIITTIILPIIPAVFFYLYPLSFPVTSSAGTSGNIVGYYVDYAYPYWWLGYDAYWSPYWTGAWYYPYPVTYEFTANSLLADMADQTVTGDDGESHPIVWSCTLSGESGSMRYDYVRFRTAIRQAFDQSSYLGKTH